jgi:hypothetical protein
MADMILGRHGANEVHLADARQDIEKDLLGDLAERRYDDGSSDDPKIDSIGRLRRC